MPAARRAAAHHIVDGNVGLALEHGTNTHRDLGRAGAEGDDGESHNERADAERQRQLGRAAHEYAGAKNQQDQAAEKNEYVHDRALYTNTRQPQVLLPQGRINRVAQITKEIGAKANPRALAKAATAYENSVVRRLGYLLEQTGHGHQARALEPFVRQARTTLPLDPGVKPIVAALAQADERNAKWKLMINEAVEVAE
jgi:hypothetical protein